MKNIKKLQIFITIVIFSMGCSGQKDIKTENNSNELEIIEECQNLETSSFINECENMLLKCTTEREKKFIFQLMEIFEKFSDKTLDTTVLTICFLDTDEEPDTIKTRIFEDKNKILVRHVWLKNNKLLWKQTNTNPYLWINDDPFFENQKWKKWVTFTIGTHYALPDVYKMEDFNDLKAFAITTGINELQQELATVDKELYKQYIENFNGNLIAWGDPESREGLYVWCEFLQRFVCFYRE